MCKFFLFFELDGCLKIQRTFFFPFLIGVRREEEMFIILYSLFSSVDSSASR